MQTSTLFVAKTNIELFKSYSVSTWKGGRREGLSQCSHFFGQGVVNFSWYCVDVLYGRSLSKKSAKLRIGH